MTEHVHGPDCAPTPALLIRLAELVAAGDEAAANREAERSGFGEHPATLLIGTASLAGHVARYYGGTPYLTRRPGERSPAAHDYAVGDVLTAVWLDGPVAGARLLNATLDAIPADERGEWLGMALGQALVLLANAYHGTLTSTRTTPVPDSPAGL